jgi:hypothetical protein
VTAFGFDGEPGPGEPWATYVQPGVDAWEKCGSQYPFSFDELELVAAAAVDHRILIRTGGSDLEVMALLRHELRHAEQYEHDEHLDRIAGVLAKGLLGMYGDTVAFRILYAATPTERDANAAAGAFVAKRGTDRERRDLVARHQTLLGAGSAPLDPTTVRDRTLAWGVVLYPEMLNGAGELAREDGATGIDERFETEALARVLMRANAIGRWDDLAHLPLLRDATKEVAVMSAVAAGHAALGNPAGARRLAERLQLLEAQALTHVK